MLGQRSKILAIDDTPLNLKILAGGLSPEFDIEITPSGREGLAMAEQSPPDIILLDVMMPDMDGYEVCRQLKANPRLSDIPVVFLTADKDSNSEVAGLALGASDYLHKPVNLKIARQRIRNLIQQAALAREVDVHRHHLAQLVAERTAQLERTNAELQLANTELKAAKVASECAHRAKSAFIANISHELYTPLNAILGINDQLRPHLPRAELQDKSDRLANAARQMHEIVKRILQLAELEGEGQVRHDQQAKFNIREVVDIAIAHFHTRASQKGLLIEREIDSNVPKTVYGLSGALRQVLENFLSNAIKFSEQGRIVVRATVETAEDACVNLKFAVIDQGVGIAEADLPDLFADFHLADSSLSRRFGGIGIGLAINRHLAKLLNGQIGVSSTLGQGSCFWVSVPLYHFSFEWLASKAAVSDAYVDVVAEAFANSGEPPPQNEVSWELDHLINLLALDDMAAQQAWRQASPVLAPRLGERLQVFTQALEAFAFDEARAILLDVRDTVASVRPPGEN